MQSVMALKFVEGKSEKRSLLKVLINHSYFISFIDKFDVNWSEETTRFSEFIDNYLTPVPKEALNIDCLLDKYFESYDLVSNKPFL